MPKVTVKELLTCANGCLRPSIRQQYKEMLGGVCGSNASSSTRIARRFYRSLVLAMPALQAWALVQGRIRSAGRCGISRSAHFCTPFNDGGSIDPAMDVVAECLKEPTETCARGFINDILIWFIGAVTASGGIQMGMLADQVLQADGQGEWVTARRLAQELLKEQPQSHVGHHVLGRPRLVKETMLEFFFPPKITGYLCIYI